MLQSNTLSVFSPKTGQAEDTVAIEGVFSSRVIEAGVMEATIDGSNAITGVVTGTEKPGTGLKAIVENFVYTFLLPTADSSKPYAIYVKLQSGTQVTSNGLGTAGVFRYLRLLGVAPTWETPGSTIAALPSGASTLFALNPAPSVKVLSDTGQFTNATVTCVLSLSSITPRGRSTMSAFLTGNTTEVGKVNLARTFQTVTWGAVGIIGPANSDAKLVARCQVEGNSQVFPTPTEQDFYVAEVQAVWTQGASADVLPTLVGSGGAVDLAAVEAITPAPEVTLQYRFNSAVSFSTITVGAADASTVRVPISVTATGATAVGRSVVSLQGTSATSLTASQAFNRLGLAGQLNTSVDLRAACVWVSGETFLTPATTGSIADLRAQWEGAAAAATISNPLVFLYNTPLPTLTASVYSWPLGGTPTALSGGSVSAADLVCSIRATTTTGSVSAVAVPYSGTTAPRLQSGALVVDVNGLTLSPPQSTLDYSAATGFPVHVDFSLSCSFRGQTMPTIPLKTELARLGAVWTTAPASPAMTSTSEFTVALPAASVAVVDGTGAVLTSDNTASCTLTIVSAVDITNAALSASATSLVGTTTVTAVSGVATFQDWAVIAPLGATVNVAATCTRAEGGPTASASATVRIYEAEVTGLIASAVGAGATDGAAYALPTPADLYSAITASVAGGHAVSATQQPDGSYLVDSTLLFYDTVATTTASLRLVDRSSSTTISYNSSVLPPASCSLSLVSLQAQGVSAAATGSLSGDNADYTGVGVEESGQLQFPLRFIAAASIAQALQITCSVGGSTISSTPLIVSVVPLTLQFTQQPPEEAVSSVATLGVPIAPLVTVQVLDPLGTPVTDDSLTTCTVAVDSFVMWDAAEAAAAIAAGATLSADVNALAGTTSPLETVSGTSSFADLMVAAPFGCNVTLVFTCQRSSLGPTAQTSAVVMMKGLKANWFGGMAPPAYALYNTPYYLEVQLTFTSWANYHAPVAYDPMMYEPAVCTLQLSDSDLGEGQMLGGGVRKQTGRANGNGVANSTMYLQGFPSVTAHVSVACDTMGTRVMTPTSDVVQESLVAIWQRAPPARAMLSSGAVKIAIGQGTGPNKPVPLVRFETSRGTQFDASSVSCRIVVNNSAVNQASLTGPFPPRVLEAPDLGWIFDSTLQAVPFDNLFLSADMGTVLPFSAQCARSEGDVIPPLPYTMTTLTMEPHWVAQPPAEVVSGTPYSIQVSIFDANAGTLLTDDNSTTCIISTLPSALIINGRESAVQGVVTWPDATVLGVVGASYSFVVNCFLGDVPLSTQLSTPIAIAGCPPGQAPVGDGTSCETCLDGSYSDGGVGRCIACPNMGVRCTGGRLTLLEGYFLAGGTADTARDAFAVNISDASEVHPCWNPTACLVNSTKRTYACADGYSGPLCGVCRLSEGFVKQVQTCANCYSHNANFVMIGLGALVILGMLVFVSYKMDWAHISPARTVFRVMVNYIATLSILTSLYTARGTPMFRFVWSGIAAVGVPGSSATLDVAPLQCELQLPYYTRYYTIVLLPAVLAVLSIILHSGVAVVAKARQGLEAIKTEIVQFFHTWRPFSVLTLMVLLMYHSIVTQAFSIFGCMKNRIGGKIYMQAELSVNCETAAHELSELFGYLVIFLFALGFPALYTLLIFYWRKKVPSAEGTPFFAALGILFQGYKTDKWYHTAWESAVMLRKAFLVLVGVLVKDPWYSAASAMIILCLSFAIQLYLQPYQERVHNVLDASSTFCIILSLGIAMLYLRANAIAALAADPSYTGEKVTVGSIAGTLLSEKSTTAALFTINIIMLIVLVTHYYRTRKAEGTGRTSPLEWVLDRLMSLTMFKPSTETVVVVDEQGNEVAVHRLPSRTRSMADVTGKTGKLSRSRSIRLPPPPPLPANFKLPPPPPLPTHTPHDARFPVHHPEVLHHAPAHAAASSEGTALLSAAAVSAPESTAEVVVEAPAAEAPAAEAPAAAAPVAEAAAE